MHSVSVTTLNNLQLTADTLQAAGTNTAVEIDACTCDDWPSFLTALALSTGVTSLTIRNTVLPGDWLVLLKKAKQLTQLTIGNCITHSDNSGLQE